MALKVGDKVWINPNSEYAHGDDQLPFGVPGIVTRVLHNERHIYRVEWMSHFGYALSNVYRPQDLICVQPTFTESLDEWM